MATIQEGKAAPAFTLADAKGKEVSLADFAGRNVILYFYPRDDTPGCTKEACGFRDAWKEIGKLEAVVLGVSADGEASHQKFIAKYKLPFPLLSDPECASTGRGSATRRSIPSRCSRRCGAGRAPRAGVYTWSERVSFGVELLHDGIPRGRLPRPETGLLARTRTRGFSLTGPSSAA